MASARFAGIARSMLLRSVAVAAFALICSVASAGAVLRPSALDGEAPFRRFLWVTRWDFRTPEDIERIFYNAASARFTDVFFQVRGEGTVFFKSPHEPWAWELSGRGPESGVGIDPGWDPLAVAIKEARRRGVRIHAYLNVMPVWAQKVSPPKGEGQIYADRKSWLMVHTNGKTMTPAGFYACVDPGIPEVREHFAKLFGSLVKDYDVDGVHLDYIRYPHERGDLSHHPRVLKDFKEWYGKTPAQAPEKWIEYKRKQVTQTVAAIRESINKARPGIELSAAVFADPMVGQTKACQEPLVWLAKGYVDAVAPMVYVEDMPTFRSYLQRYEAANANGRVWVGMRALPKNTVLMPQIEMSAKNGYGGVAVFCYEDLFKGHRQQGRARAVYEKFVSFKHLVKPKQQPIEIAADDGNSEGPSETERMPILAAGFGPPVTINGEHEETPKLKRRIPSLKVKMD